MARENVGSKVPKDAPIHPETKLPMPLLNKENPNLPPDVFFRYPAPHAVSKSRPPRPVSVVRQVPFWPQPLAAGKLEDDSAIPSPLKAHRSRS
jgi:hypothetical protein